MIPDVSIAWDCYPHQGSEKHITMSTKKFFTKIKFFEKKKLYLQKFDDRYLNKNIKKLKFVNIREQLLN